MKDSINVSFLRALKENEKISAYTKKSPLVLFIGVFLSASLIVATVFGTIKTMNLLGKEIFFFHDNQLYYVEEDENIVDAFIYLWTGGAALAVAAVILAIKLFLSDRFAVTNQKRILLKIKRLNLPIEVETNTISKVDVKTGLFGKLFNYGTVLIYLNKEAYYAKDKIKSRFVKNPFALANRVNEITETTCNEEICPSV